MHPLFFQFSARWWALVTGASHVTSALRAMSREAPAAEFDDDEFDPPPDMSMQLALPLPIPCTSRTQAPKLA